MDMPSRVHFVDEGGFGGVDRVRVLDVTQRAIENSKKAFVPTKRLVFSLFHEAVALVEPNSSTFGHILTFCFHLGKFDGLPNDR